MGDLGGTRDRQLKCASMALAGALKQDDILKAAALLRCAAKFLEGAADAGGDASGVRSDSPEQDWVGLGRKRG